MPGLFSFDRATKSTPLLIFKETDFINFSKDGPSSTMMVLAVEPHYNYMLLDHVMTSLYALHALPLAFHALSSIVVDVETLLSLFMTLPPPF